MDSEYIPRVDIGSARPMQCRVSTERYRTRCSFFRTLLVFLIGSWAMTGCTPGGPSVGESEHANIINAIRNMTYDLSPTVLHPVTVTNGRFVGGESALDGSFLEVNVTKYRAIGALDSFEEAAAVVLTSNAGGSGTFFHLAVVAPAKKGYENIAGTPLGDRQKIENIAITDRKIRLTRMTHTESDPMCCPSKRQTSFYILSGDSLVAAEQE
jgi:hypothetical protein